MKKSIIAFVITCSFVLSSCQQTGTKVYVCTGGSSVCYHKTSKCMGLSNCSKSIKKISQENATSDRNPCKICYKNKR